MNRDKIITVLLAEDDEFISKAYKDGLTRAGFNIISAADGNEALALAREQRPDIYILDLIMPFKNGFEVLEELKKDDANKGIPILVLSNLGQESDIAKTKELGATDYLIKSDISMQEVVAKINSLLKR